MISFFAEIRKNVYCKLSEDEEQKVRVFAEQSNCSIYDSIISLYALGQIAIDGQYDADVDLEDIDIEKID